jgi:hypothetical protein
MEHHGRAIGNPIGVGVFAVLAGLGVAHLGRFRASAFARTSLGFGSGPQPCTHLSSTPSRCLLSGVKRTWAGAVQMSAFDPKRDIGQHLILQWRSGPQPLSKHLFEPLRCLVLRLGA